MFARILNAVFLLFLCGSSAQAGLMVRGGVNLEDQGLDRGDAMAVVDWFAGQQQENPTLRFLQERCGDFAAVTLTSRIGGSPADVGRYLPREFQRVLLFRVRLLNSSLPQVPVLDGLLKPS